MKSLGITGQRPYSVLPLQRQFGFNKTHAGVRWFAENGFDTVISGMAMGVDQWAATQALVQKMTLIAALPFAAEDQSRKWDDQAREAYHLLLESASRVWIAPAQARKFDGYSVRNQWIVDHAESMLVVTNGSRSGGTWDCIGRIATAGLPGVLVQTSKERVIRFDNAVELAMALGLELDDLKHQAA